MDTAYNGVDTAFFEQSCRDLKYDPKEVAEFVDVVYALGFDSDNFKFGISRNVDRFEDRLKVTLFHSADDFKVWKDYIYGMIKQNSGKSLTNEILFTASELERPHSHPDDPAFITDSGKPVRYMRSVNLEQGPLLVLFLNIEVKFSWETLKF